MCLLVVHWSVVSKVLSLLQTSCMGGPAICSIKRAKLLHCIWGEYSHSYVYDANRCCVSSKKTTDISFQNSNSNFCGLLNVLKQLIFLLFKLKLCLNRPCVNTRIKQPPLEPTVHWSHIEEDVPDEAITVSLILMVKLLKLGNRIAWGTYILTDFGLLLSLPRTCCHMAFYVRSEKLALEVVTLLFIARSKIWKTSTMQ